MVTELLLCSVGYMMLPLNESSMILYGNFLLVIIHSDHLFRHFDHVNQFESGK